MKLTIEINSLTVDMQEAAPTVPTCRLCGINPICEIRMTLIFLTLSNVNDVILEELKRSNIMFV